MRENHNFGALRLQRRLHNLQKCFGLGALLLSVVVWVLILPLCFFRGRLDQFVLRERRAAHWTLALYLNYLGDAGSAKDVLAMGNDWVFEHVDANWAILLTVDGKLNCLLQQCRVLVIKLYHALFRQKVEKLLNALLAKRPMTAAKRQGGLATALFVIREYGYLHLSESKQSLEDTLERSFVFMKLFHGALCFGTLGGEKVNEEFRRCKWVG